MTQPASQEDFQHISVLLQEAVDALVHQPQGHYLDGTFGRGGHSRAILQSLHPEGRLYAFDKDPQAFTQAQKLHSQDARLYPIQDSFAQMQTHLHQITGQAHAQLDGILLDLGVSSPQLDDPERGFSFLHDGPLDMRMNPDVGESAAQWIARASATEIADVLYHYGEERFSRRMAKAIVEARQQAPITRTQTLAEIIKAANPAWEKGKHPATRAFQGIRIYINRELDDLKEALQAAITCLKPGGRLVVISFHSLEDRIVKRFMRDLSRGDTHLPVGIPLTQDQLQCDLKLLSKAIRPSAQEVAANPRARSAVMRVAQRL
ncbi:16S rRNA (cytosine1402-N4)-methyltransferase [Allopseudospirillum japonicum]|uniref:Ribosomal RNA small subunit methyltransferase H n=1 Tax=Allopseudospirillum japonicum TaxID=64971 RepID=A0A1H6QIS1_9GAMM|nr:16S rRNA (cytosine(1402)-N(4))-methyltransferase RsmH [Allopseudospirillum japonicum]SEI40077.1 16S rRNA (cytosine1402-N4)-methyltransferase [Allopseudospirillum japonicum]